MAQTPQTNQRENPPQIERRFSIEGAEVRANQEGKPELFGYALKWGVSYDLGWFTEEISRNALDASDMSDVRVLFNHDASLILGRTAAGTAQVGKDETGLWYRAVLPESPTGENVRVALERGDVTQSSWGFYIRQDETGRRTGDKWEIRGGKEHRIITDVSKVVDASPVTYPANPDTSVAKRSHDEARKEARSEFEEAKMEAVQPDLTDTYDKLRRSLELKAAHYNNK